MTAKNKRTTSAYNFLLPKTFHFQTSLQPEECVRVLKTLPLLRSSGLRWQIEALSTVLIVDAASVEDIASSSMMMGEMSYDSTLKWTNIKGTAHWSENNNRQIVFLAVWVVAAVIAVVLTGGLFIMKLIAVLTALPLLWLVVIRLRFRQQMIDFLMEVFREGEKGLPKDADIKKLTLRVRQAEIEDERLREKLRNNRF